ncbi:MAG: bifunctional hydroxymethylpyrimidine kinase/phosphomethylpyrimidine kinase [Sphingomonadales bacterium]|nr:bifunctional hydroxymethylpyrimidine kinase/phosphomethylpyrimidine kinase [Sphingomonadales bacterium]
MTIPRVLTIAGSDPSGGAGIQADIKTITCLGGHAMSALTAITVQDTHAVRAVELLPPALVVAQIDACLDDIGADAIKVGMLGSAAIARAVAARLGDARMPIVFDPVLAASSGEALADADALAAFAALMPLCALVTPNPAELAALGGAVAMAGHGRPWLAKGGDLAGTEVVDVLHVPGGRPRRFAAPRIATRHSHGTGCTLASAIATELARGASLVEAVERGRGFVRAALLAAPGLGGGAGPLGHGQALRGAIP